MNTGIDLALHMMPPAARRRALPLLGVMVINAVVEVSGVAGIMPVVSLASDPGSLQRTPWMLALYEGLHFTDPRTFLVAMAAAFFLLFALVNSCRALTTWLSLRFSFLVSHLLAHRLLTTYLGRPYLWLRSQNSNDLSKDILHEVEQLVRNVYLPIAEIATNLLASGLIAITLLVLDPLLAVGSGLALLALFSLIYQVNRGPLERNGLERDRLNGERYRAVNEALYALREARLLLRRPHFSSRFEKLSERYNGALVVGETVYELPHYLTEIVAVGALIGTLVYFSLRSQGQAVAWLMLYVMATWRMIPPLQNIYRNLARIRFFMPALERLAAELEQQPSPLPEGPCRLPFERALSLSEVHFAYPGRAGDVLQGLTLDIPRGCHLALVGRTGSGKTTLADLVAGLLQPTSGKILLDDQPLPEHWLQQVGYVPQEIFLSDATVADNIALGLDHADPQSLAWAARAARIEELPLELALGERGAALSGGQRQRIGLARALYHRPQVLILDEATSALDETTQREILDNLRQLPDLTVLVIAHRLEVVRACDRVVVLQEGKLVGEGSYADLVERCLPFQALLGQEMPGPE